VGIYRQGRLENMIRSVWVALLAGLSLSSCSWMHRGGEKCREPLVPSNVQNNALLHAAPGLDAADTRNAISIPPLTEPEKPRAKSDCLSLPPSYGS
jgi:hypothetical protein